MASAAAPTAEPAPKDVAKRAERIGVLSHATFAGRVGDNMTGLFEHWAPRGDGRDLDAVRAFASDLMMRAPAPLAPQQLADLGLRIEES